MKIHETKVRVRYAETDQMSYVYYGNYAMYYEVGRVEALRAVGITYREIEESGVMMPVLENHSKYMQAARYDDEITIKVSIPEAPKVKITFKCELYNTAGELIHVGTTTLAFVDMQRNRPIRCPQHLYDALSPYFLD
ncbi:MAG: acyl-CoA thioesterase [Cyclobacteriaceae bacterium]|nr:acyl-CoA thioesterase [Cyclobacteriaceae bacterium]MCH8515345.1 acyl-CoA thioesterase [Cyclobacteriaceae bacterium]